MKRFSLLMVTVFIFALLAVPGQSLAKTTKLTLQCVYPATAYVGQSTEFFADRVNELTNGEVTIKIFWPDQLVKTNEAFKSLKTGMIDMYSGSMLYFAGEIPEVNCEWLPFGWANPQEAVDVYQNHGWLELMREATAKHGAHYVAPLCVASMGLITKFPVRQVDDLKGKKIRAVGMEAKIIDALGGATVSLSGAEQYMALKQGVVDGTDYPFYTIEKYKFYEVCNYISRPALHTPGIVELVINGESFGKLTPAQQKAIDQAGWETFLRTAKLNEEWDQQAYETCKEKNVEIIDLTPEQLAEFRTKLIPLWDELAAKTDISRRLVESLKAYVNK
ncbi:MAG: TRAP transporter substrate-binding protein DctP [Proteobacteria bacterium]|nr:TRAP transporter substrate-binding protein DctP [Pseudomonadota bacterium]MBU1388991.1 TRAP transporter substrate-binding protein DctP [Pseudomonadota bacterium]MBU1543543.1 TRAP transporter substrate-binding protein DctP [Pseudomonadota bacterium]MBU2429155.1 TRAP transporter substrate-binding protein DctP [Pseudomonadota bacterium]MBU2480655.1 TRAP transporter substrate-binding protein DctP [Pseudomonadota bacterium]